MFAWSEMQLISIEMSMWAHGLVPVGGDNTLTPKLGLGLLPVSAPPGSINSVSSLSIHIVIADDDDPAHLSLAVNGF